MSVIHVASDEEFTRLVNDANFKSTIVDFSATWCGPCKMVRKNVPLSGLYIKL